MSASLSCHTPQNSRNTKQRKKFLNGHIPVLALWSSGWQAVVNKWWPAAPLWLSKPWLEVAFFSREWGSCLGLLLFSPSKPVRLASCTVIFWQGGAVFWCHSVLHQLFLDLSVSTVVLPIGTLQQCVSLQSALVFCWGRDCLPACFEHQQSSCWCSSQWSWLDCVCFTSATFLLIAAHFSGLHAGAEPVRLDWFQVWVHKHGALTLGDFTKWKKHAMKKTVVLQNIQLLHHLTATHCCCQHKPRQQPSVTFSAGPSALIAMKNTCATHSWWFEVGSPFCWALCMQCLAVVIMLVCQTDGKWCFFTSWHFLWCACWKCTTIKCQKDHKTTVALCLRHRSMHSTIQKRQPTIKQQHKRNLKPKSSRAKNSANTACAQGAECAGTLLHCLVHQVPKSQPAIKCFLLVTTWQVSKPLQLLAAHQKEHKQSTFLLQWHCTQDRWGPEQSARGRCTAVPKAVVDSKSAAHCLKKLKIVDKKEEEAWTLTPVLAACPLFSLQCMWLTLCWVLCASFCCWLFMFLCQVSLVQWLNRCKWNICPLRPDTGKMTSCNNNTWMALIFQKWEHLCSECLHVQPIVQSQSQPVKNFKKVKIAQTACKHLKNRLSTFFSSKTLKKMSSLFQSQTANLTSLFVTVCCEEKLTAAMGTAEPPPCISACWKQQCRVRLECQGRQNRCSMVRNISERLTNVTIKWKCTLCPFSKRFGLLWLSAAPSACCWIVVHCKRVAFASLCQLAVQISHRGRQGNLDSTKGAWTEEQTKIGSSGWMNR